MIRCYNGSFLFIDLFYTKTFPMHYYQYKFYCEQALQEILLAFLGEYPFDTFQEMENHLDAYIPKEQHSEEMEDYLKSLQNQFQFTYERIFLEAKNWNAVWESNFQPIIVGDFCALRADFHAPIKNVAHELIIQPKMAFGTGHHATTFQVLQMMEKLAFEGKTVLDYGSGTGVLAILASKLGAKKIDAIDIDEWSKENSLENAELNMVNNINVMRSDIKGVIDRKYDAILANITFNVISSSLEALYSMLSEGGDLITSGFFPEDAERLKQQAEKLGFQTIQQSEREDWACVYFRKK